MKFKHSILFMLALAAIAISSCKKDEGKLPDIMLKTGGNYVSTDQTVTTEDTVLVGIKAEKTEEEDVLKTFSIIQTVADVDSTIESLQLSGTQANVFEKDYNLVAGNTAGIQKKFGFIVTNRDGLKNEVSLTLTVQ